MHEKLFSVIIPIIPNHFRYITKLLKELAGESNYIGEVLICASSVSETSRKYLEEIVGKSSGSLSIRIIATSEYRSAGENRNVGWKYAKFDYLSFLDADDIYHPQRLSLISKVLNLQDVDALVHDYYRLMPRAIFAKTLIANFEVTDTASLQRSNMSRMKNILPPGDIYSGQSNLELPSNLKEKSRVHHGHLIVRRSIPVRYSSRRAGEDGELVVEILKNDYRLIYINAKLSIYDRINFSNLRQTLFGHIQVRLSRIYRCLKKLRLK